MSIISPSGKQKNQINQGVCKNTFGLFDNIPVEILNKFALSPQEPINKKDQSLPGLNDAMNSGNMRGNQVPNKSVEPNNPMPSGKSVAPAGNPADAGQQNLSPFLAPNGTTNQQEQKQLLDEKMALRNAAGQGFSIDLERAKEGNFKLTLLPPQGYKIPNPDHFVQALMQAVEGEAEAIGDPDPRTGAMAIMYKSKNIGPTKVVKP